MLSTFKLLVPKLVRSYATLNRPSYNHISDKLLKSGKFPSRTNFGINFLDAGHKYVIERFGKFSSVKDPGLSFIIPFIDKIAYVVDNRELCIRIEPEKALSVDNVGVILGGNLYLQFFDAHKACYNVSTPIYAVTQFAQAAMRTAVGNFTLDRLFSERKELNKKVKEALDDRVLLWGCNVLSFEITDLEPADHNISIALNKQATAERERREKIITAEANKKETELNADAYKYRQITEALGDAEKKKIAADAEYYRNIKEAQSNKQAIEIISEAINKPGGIDAVKMNLSNNYFDTLSQLGQRSTIIVPQNLGDVSGMVATASNIFSQIQHKNIID